KFPVTDEVRVHTYDFCRTPAVTMSSLTSVSCGPACFSEAAAIAADHGIDNVFPVAHAGVIIGAPNSNVPAMMPAAAGFPIRLQISLPPMSGFPSPIL